MLTASLLASMRVRWPCRSYFALTDIAPLEELTVDYHYERNPRPGGEWPFVCLSEHAQRHSGLMAARRAWLTTSVTAPLIVVSAASAFESAGAIRPTASIRPGARSNRRKVGPKQLQLRDMYSHNQHHLSPHRAIVAALTTRACTRQCRHFIYQQSMRLQINATSRFPFPFIFIKAVAACVAVSLTPAAGRSRAKPASRRVLLLGQRLCCRPPDAHRACRRTAATVAAAATQPTAHEANTWRIDPQPRSPR